MDAGLSVNAKRTRPGAVVVFSHNPEGVVLIVHHVYMVPRTTEAGTKRCRRQAGDRKILGL